MRDEAERLVAAAIAAISSTVRAGQPGARDTGSRAGLATGSAECCVCPVCRAIAAMRDPAPEFADRLAAGVSDLASGVAAVLRMLQRPAPETPTQRTPESDGDEFWESLRRKAADAAKAAARVSTVDPSADHDDPWQAATTEPAPPPAPAPQPAAPAKKAMARKAVKKAAPAQAQAPAPAQVARKAAPAKAAPAKAGAAKAAPVKAPAKAAKKAAPRRPRGSET